MKCGSSGPSASICVLVLSLISVLLLSWDGTPYAASRQEQLQDPRVLCSKVDQFLQSSNNPEVWLLGSSLLLAPAKYTDADNLAALALGENGELFNYQYVRSRHLEKLIQQKFGTSTHVLNLALPAAMVSDDYLILRAALEKQKRPRLLVLGLAPRDFISNINSDPKTTYVHKIFGQYDDGPEWQMIPEPMRQGLCAISLFQNKIETRLAACKQAAKQHTEALLGGISQRATSDSPCDLRERDLVVYQSLYNPPNFKSLRNQSRYLSLLLETAQRAGVPVVVVKMPLSHENKKLLNPAIAKQYEDLLVQECTRHNASIVDPEKFSDFGSQFFVDSVHLNERGGQQFYSVLVEQLGNLKTANQSIFL